MQCDQMEEMIGAYLDQELDPASRREVAAHLASCPACIAVAADVQGIGRQVAALGRERAPTRLAADIRDRLAAATAQPRAPIRFATAEGTAWRRWLGRAAAVLLMCGLTS